MVEIVILDRLTLGLDIDISIFEQFGNVSIYDKTNENETLQRVQNKDIVITNKVVINKEHMDNSNIKLICVTATGMNNIHLEYAKQKQIEVKNVAGYSSSSVTQLAFSMIFHFIQKLNYYKSYVDEGKWQESPIFTNLDKPFYELDNKKVGIIGLGNIGKDFAKKMKAFDCEIIYYSSSGKNTNSAYKQVDLDELLSTCDIISIHCPLNENTKDLLKYENMKKIKDKAILLNLSRGGIINEADLARILDEKEIYAGIDVASVEPILHTNPLLKVKNKNRLLLTPHIAWGSIEARTKLIKLVALNIKEFLESKNN